MQYCICLFAIAIFSVGFASAAEQTHVDVVSTAPKASFFLIGGAADTALDDFVRLAGGVDASIAIITHASDDPDAAGDEMQNQFTALNANNTTVILPSSKVGLPSGASAVYICGGDQNRLKRLLSDALLKQLAEFEGLIGGSSAGAMIAAPQMIAGGMDAATLRGLQLRVGEGLAFLPGVVIDTHCGQRGRDTRSIAALALISSVELAIGLDEDTAIHIAGGKCTVYGAGHARLYRRGPNFTSNLTKAGKGQVANAKDVLLNLLSAGDEFDLEVKKPAGNATGKAGGGTNGKAAGK